jgi:hypothetical protein
MKTWTRDELDRIATAEELEVAFLHKVFFSVSC